MADNSPNACDYLARGMLPNSRIGPARAINDYGRTNGIAGAYSLIGPAQVGSRIALLATRRYFSMETIGIITVSALPLSLALLLVLPQIEIAPCLMLVLYGTANGLVTILRGTAIPDLIGSEGYGSINATITLVARIGAALAPIAVALAWDKFGSYGPVVWGLFALAVIAAVSYGVAIYAAEGGKP